MGKLEDKLFEITAEKLRSKNYKPETEDSYCYFTGEREAIVEEKMARDEANQTRAMLANKGLSRVYPEAFLAESWDVRRADMYANTVLKAPPDMVPPDDSHIYFRRHTDSQITREELFMLMIDIQVFYKLPVVPLFMYKSPTSDDIIFTNHSYTPIARIALESLWYSTDPNIAKPIRKVFSNVFSG